MDLGGYCTKLLNEDTSWRKNLFYNLRIKALDQPVVSSEQILTIIISITKCISYNN